MKGIRTSFVSRGFSFAKASLKIGTLTASQMLTSKSGRSAGWLKHLDYLIDEIGQLKGSAMKVGQSLSMYGEHLLPPEINERLKKLQQDSPSMSWPTIESILIKELGADILAELDVEASSIAAASIGQVHRARIKTTGELIALKIQYPGIERAIEVDLKLLKFILNMGDRLPSGLKTDQIFSEVREMFYQEIDYSQERGFSEYFANALTGDERYHVPKIYPRYSTHKILASEFVAGHRADTPEVQALSLERRNRLGQAYFELYLRELLELKQMQTDPHLGNYVIQIDPTGENDRLVLFDFGAVRSVPREFLSHYVLLIEGGLKKDERMIERGGRALKLLLPEDPIELVRDYIDLSLSLMEPFNGMFDWGKNDLPKRVAEKITNVAVNYRLRTPPRELVFLDRKLGGVFVFLSILNCHFDARPWLELAFKNYSASPNLE